MTAYRVVPFSPGALAEIVVEKSFEKATHVSEKAHVEYLGDYLAHLGACTIIVEEEYVDRDFLEDFAAYYVRCFAPYKRVCARLHFFSADIADGEFLKILLREGDSGAIREGYLGFVVVKPLPDTVIGRTCLKPWPNSEDRKRDFPVACTVPVNLFGLDLSVTSLPFQEQDTDVAACATSALWSVLNGTGRIFQHAIPSPVEITRAASVHSRIDDRSFPNRNGLNAFQIADAIRSVGLEPFAVRGSDAVMVRLATAAYLRAGIPCLLLSELFDKKANSTIGRHAVALVGYSFSSIKPKPYKQSKTLFRAASIDRLYCHDDQIGPYSKLEFSASNTIHSDANTEVRPENLIIPLYHKVRIPFGTIIDKVVQLDTTLELLRQAGLVPIPERLVWDVYLNDIGRLRKRVSLSKLSAEAKLLALKRSYPRYVWCADARIGNERQFSLIFDATDLLQGQQFLDCIAFEKAVCAAIAVVSGHPSIQSSSPVFAWFNSNADKFV
jgi:hypothetical protein